MSRLVTLFVLNFVTLSLDVDNEAWRRIPQVLEDILT